MNNKDTIKNQTSIPTKLTDSGYKNRINGIRIGTDRPSLKKRKQRLNRDKRNHNFILRNDLVKEQNTNPNELVQGFIAYYQNVLPITTDTMSIDNRDIETKIHLVREIDTEDKLHKYLKKLEHQLSGQLLNYGKSNLYSIRNYEEERTLAINYLLRNAWCVFGKHPNNRFYFTISFFSGTNDQTCRDAFVFLYNQLCKDVYSKHFRRDKKFLRGIFVEERQLNGTLHYHVNLRDDDKYFDNLPQFKRMIYKILPKLKAKSPTGEYIDAPITNIDCVDIQNFDPHKENKVMWYLTKCFENPTTEYHARSSSIGILGVDGVLFGDSKPIKRKS